MLWGRVAGKHAPDPVLRRPGHGTGGYNSPMFDRVRRAFEGEHDVAYAVVLAPAPGARSGQPAIDMPLLAPSSSNVPDLDEARARLAAR